MVKTSPILRSGNRGEISVLMEGRTDWDGYPASMRTMLNFIAAQQGPLLRRSGSVFLSPAYDHSKRSAILAFVFSEEQAQTVEFAEDRIRFIDELGLLTYTAVSVSAVVADNPLEITAAGLAAVVGDEIALSGFPEALGINGTVGRVTAVSSDDYTTDIVSYSNPDALAITGAQASRVYHVASTYQEEDVPNIRALQSLDVLYLFCPGHRVRTLSRSGVTSWTLADLEFRDGPYLPLNADGVTLVPSGTGNAAVETTTGTASGAAAGGHAAADAFNEDLDTYWESNTDQTGTLVFDPTTDFACTGYSIHVAKENSNTSYVSTDYAPGDWDFMGYDGASWVVLDTQIGYVLYDGDRSAFFELNNDTVYEQYRIVIHKCSRNGPIHPRIAELALTSAASTSIGITASGTTGINDGSGFLATDVGRAIRVRGSDTLWRWADITARASATSITVTLKGDPLPDLHAIASWRVGQWSDTTGWPTCGLFFDDRLVVSGAAGAPDLVAGTVTGGYSNTYADMKPTDPAGVVLADSAFAVQLNSRQLAKVRWIEGDERSILLGTGSAVYVITAPDSNSALGPLNIRARRTARRGSADADAVAVDKQVLHLERARRGVRETAYVFEADGYKSPSMSIFSSHLGNDRFAQMEYAADPHSIVWVRQDSGTLVGLTYNRDENVVGWHRHDVGGEIESICVLPAQDDRQDILFMAVKRTVDGNVRRYIERLAPFWDFDSTVEEAHYVDCGLYTEFGSPTSTVYLPHLIGEEVYGIMDGVPFDLQEVGVNGLITLPEEATKVVVGLPFTSLAETSRIDTGAKDGTAQGKEKRPNVLVANMWDSAGGEIGVWSDETGDHKWEPMEYNEAPYNEIETNTLRTEISQELTLPEGYSKRGSIAMRQSEPLPFNVIALMPQMNTYDR